jgi:hypothetical protein
MPDRGRTLAVVDDVDVAALRDIADPLTRARRAHLAIPVVEQIRNEAISEANLSGVTQAAIGSALGITAARVSQILKGGPGPERAFWGADGGRLTVALGGKTEAAKNASGTPGPVVAVEDFAAYEALQASVASLGIETRYEVIPPPGLVNLNRAGLVVICGPRLSPLVAQVLASDRALAFACDDGGCWAIEDRRSGTKWQSPSDSGEPADIAYLGRLPRPDGLGTFIYIAGIHAAGAGGVVHLLAGELDQAWQRVRDHRFSVLIRCTYDPRTREITGSELLTDFYEGN